ncbi:unnamed protein product [Haemonchus placei]|uniref:Pept_C1 domain-containing protein n=1 Tax=Haemonchus placei TaxID=6290 RepID=A0A158QLJ6_HAEPC|nr:unnamed protein product [Haemonchus placei]
MKKSGSAKIPAKDDKVSASVIPGLAYSLRLLCRLFISRKAYNRVLKYPNFPGKLPTHPSPGEANILTGAALVDYVNSRQSLFEAKYSPEAEHRLGYLMSLDFIKNARKLYSIPRAEKSTINVSIPESFDAREEWKNCSSITYIRDQSKCGSCWAVSAAEAMSDRICVQTRGNVQKLISGADILSCCGTKSVYILDEDEKAIQREIVKNGPVQAAFIVYGDFSYYRRGIYVVSNRQKYLIFMLAITSAVRRTYQ